MPLSAIIIIMILISIPHSNTKRNNMLYKHFLPKSKHSINYRYNAYI